MKLQLRLSKSFKSQSEAARFKARIEALYKEEFRSGNISDGELELAAAGAKGGAKTSIQIDKLSKDTGPLDGFDHTNKVVGTGNKTTPDKGNKPPWEQ